MKKMKTIKRLSLLLLAVLLLITTLVSCSGGLDTRIKDGEKSEEYFARILKLDATAREKFVAASRGYNMYLSWFKDAEVDPGMGVSVNMTIAREALAAVRPEGEAAAAFDLQLNALTGELVVETVHWLTLNDEQWTAKKAQEGWSQDPACYFADLLRGNADAKAKFETAKAFAEANVINPEKDSHIATFSTLEGYEIAVSVKAAREALKELRPNEKKYASDAATFDKWSSELTAEQIRDIAGRTRDEADLSGASFPGIILVWIGKFLQVITNITAGNYVLALFFFALIVEILMLPLGIKQQKNSQKQARMRPKEMAIRKKYAGRNDQKSIQAMQQEIQRLYQEEGFNPMSGCLPLLIQLPIVLVLYNIVVDPIRYVFGKAQALSSVLTSFFSTARAAGGLGESISSSRGTIELLSKLSEDKVESLRKFAYFSNADACANELGGVDGLNFNFLGLDTGATPDIKQISWLWLIPVLTFVIYFFSMKLNRKFSYQPATMTDQQMGCSNNMMDITMPLMSVYITFIVPGALGIYWMVKSILSTLKQFIIHKTMPLPQCTEEDIKAAERELKGKKPPKTAAGTRTTGDGRVIRSLHHIDDEDDLPPRGSLPTAKRGEETEEKPEAPAKKTDPNAPVLKEDRKNDSDKK